MMLHGTADSVIPYSQGCRLYDVAPTPKWFLPIDGAGHDDFIDVMGHQKYTETMRSFLDKGYIK